MFFSSVAMAQNTGAQPQASLVEMMLPFVLIFAIFYFLIIRPQSKKAKSHQKFVSELKRGDLVLTSGGILGTIEGLTELYVNLEISEGVTIKILRTQIVGPASEVTKK